MERRHLNHPGATQQQQTRDGIPETGSTPGVGLERAQAGPYTAAAGIQANTCLTHSNGRPPP